jgi:hypothetical protein
MGLAQDRHVRVGPAVKQEQRKMMLLHVMAQTNASQDMQALAAESRQGDAKTVH